MEDPKLWTLDYVTKSKLWMLLDNPETMRSFMEVLPPDCSCEKVRIAMKIADREDNMTSARYLLEFLSSKGYHLSDLINWFQESHIDRAIVILEKEAPIYITEQPPGNVVIREGDELILTCCAISYPLPAYQWFKDDVILVFQTDSVLLVKPAKVEDSGVYTCRVTKWNDSKNGYEWLYSSFSTVTILHSDLHELPLPESTGLNMHSFHNISDVNSDSRKKECISITRQPYVSGKVAQGMPICLICEAKSMYPVNFQWLKDGKPLAGAKSNELVLRDLYPDIDGRTSWQYQCEVFNEYDKALSEIVKVELDEPNETTPYKAQDKIALLIANDEYDQLENLLKPAADVVDLAKLLSSIDFKILAFRNLTLTEMRNALFLFCQTLKPGSYAVFYYAGHGFDFFGQTYLQPVDSSEDYSPQESLCCEYILQCMQETNPALNVLFIDACRKLPPSVSGKERKSGGNIQPGKIFHAKMKNNTVYGYSTSFLYSSHECDSEDNSIFVKHLKKHIVCNKTIQDILMLVQRDFSKDPLAKNIQFPTIKSTLSLPRKLTDPIINLPSLTDQNIFKFCKLKRDPIAVTFPHPELKSIITIESCLLSEVFCNDVDIFVYIHLQQFSSLNVLADVTVNVAFESNAIMVFPQDEFFLKNATVQIGKKTFLFRKQICSIQKLNKGLLKGFLVINFISRSITKYISFYLDLSPIVNLKLSVNRLVSENVDTNVNKTYNILSNCKNV